MPTSRAAGSAWVMSCPSSRIEPLAGSTSPAIPFSSVDLPQPDGPSSTRNSPPATSSDTSSTMRVPPRAIESLRIVSDAMRSALQGAGRDAANEPAAGPEIEHEGNERRQQRRGHVDVVETGPGRRIDDVVELYRHRLVLAPREHEAEEIVVP